MFAVGCNTKVIPLDKLHFKQGILRLLICDVAHDTDKLPPFFVTLPRFIQTLVAYHSLDSSDAEPPDKSEREEADVPAVDVVEWLENSAKLAANENLVSSDALVEEVFTNDADQSLSPMSTSVEAGTITGGFCL